MRASWRDEDGAWRTTLRGRQVLADPRINKGTAFGDSERRDLGLTGLIPAAHFTLDDQVTRVYAQYRCQPDDLARNVTLNALHDRTEVLFYRLLTGHLNEMLPIVYTPTVGQAIEHYSREYRRPRGIYLSVDHPELIEASLLASDLGPDDVDLIVATGAGAIPGNRGLGGRRHRHRGGEARRLHRGGIVKRQTAIITERHLEAGGSLARTAESARVTTQQDWPRPATRIARFVRPGWAAGREMRATDGRRALGARR
jgi:hypothetical protein